MGGGGGIFLADSSPQFDGCPLYITVIIVCRPLVQYSLYPRLLRVLLLQRFVVS